jgi:hypothetical protein
MCGEVGAHELARQRVGGPDHAAAPRERCLWLLALPQFRSLICLYDSGRAALEEDWNLWRELAMTSQLEVGAGSATADMVAQAWTEILSEVSDEGTDARLNVEHYGISPDVLASASVEVAQQERDFGITLLVIIGAPVTVHILNSLWDDMVRPRLRKKFKVDGGPVVE